MLTRVMKRSVFWLLALLPIGFVGLTFPHFRTVMRRRREQLLSGGQLAVTEYGVIEYAVEGSGPLVLLVHGAGGGYDQGLLIGKSYVGSHYTFIAPSRFGYVRNPIPDNGSPAAQADAYAALLDALGVGQVGVVAFSDGGPSALQFALRHPHRCTALVMLSAKSQTPPPETLLQRLVFESIFRSDYLFWLITQYLQSFVLSMFGVSQDVQQHATPRVRQLVADFLESMHPISLRQAGIDHNRATLGELPEDEFLLDQITVPTLVIHAVDDGLQPYQHGVHTATRVPNAQFVSYEQGGHLLALHLEEAYEQVGGFLQLHRATPAIVS